MMYGMKPSTFDDFRGRGPLFGCLLAENLVDSVRGSACAASLNIIVASVSPWVGDQVCV
jgi:hypothetical protein